MNTCKLSPQKSSPSPCEAKDIFEINSKKEYALLGSYLLRRVITDKALNADSSKLWQILYDKSKFDKNLEVKVSYSRLAEILGKSVRTIQRYASTLEALGYLSIEPNFASNKAQGVNTFIVRFPEHIIEEAKQQKDRQEPLSEKEITTLVEHTSSIAQTDTEENTNQHIPTEQSVTLCKEDKTVRGGGDKNIIQYNISKDINIINGFVA